MSSSSPCRQSSNQGLRLTSPTDTAKSSGGRADRVWHPTSFEQTLSRVIEARGDTDTNGAVAGAMLGAPVRLPKRFQHGGVTGSSNSVPVEDPFAGP